jgi:hypothetical protein
VITPLKPLKKVRPRRSDPKEKDIERKVCQYAKAAGCLVYKFTSPAHRGVPDRMFMSPHGFVWFVEFKRLNEKPTTNQEREIAKLRSYRQWVWIIDTVECGCALVDACILAETVINARTPLPGTK